MHRHRCRQRRLAVRRLLLGAQRLRLHHVCRRLRHQVARVRRLLHAGQLLARLVPLCLALLQRRAQLARRDFHLALHAEQACRISSVRASMAQAARAPASVTARRPHHAAPPARRLCRAAPGRAPRRPAPQMRESESEARTPRCAATAAASAHPLSAVQPLEQVLALGLEDNDLRHEASARRARAKHALRPPRGRAVFSVLARRDSNSSFSSATSSCARRA